MGSFLYMIFNWIYYTFISSYCTFITSKYNRNITSKQNLNITSKYKLNSLVLSDSEMLKEGRVA